MQTCSLRTSIITNFKHTPNHLILFIYLFCRFFYVVTYLLSKLHPITTATSNSTTVDCFCMKDQYHWIGIYFIHSETSFHVLGWKKLFDYFKVPPNLVLSIMRATWYTKLYLANSWESLVIQFIVNSFEKWVKLFILIYRYYILLLKILS